MTLTFTIIGFVLLFVSFIGCVLPVVPGPVFAFLGLLSLLLTDHHPSTTVICVATGLVVLSFVLDSLVPALSAKGFKCSRAGVIGCFWGSILGCVLGAIVSLFCTIFVGAFVTLLALLLGPFVGTLIGELHARRSRGEALRGALGALVGYVVAVALKLVVCLVLTILFCWVRFGS